MESKDKEQFVNNWLDSALKQYGEAEPRGGLENRVLAAARAERRTTHNWRWRPALAALAAILLIAAGTYLVRWQRGNGQPPLAKENQLPTNQKALQPSPAKTSPVTEAANGRSRLPRTHSRRVVESAAARLDQFPSPEPLSEQEKILARYVQQFPREANVTAQIQTELAREEMMAERMPPEKQISPDSELQNQ